MNFVPILKTLFRSHKLIGPFIQHMDIFSVIFSAPAFLLDVFAGNFYARQLYRQVLLRARISYGNSYGFKAR